jgi:hypothetical protein
MAKVWLVAVFPFPPLRNGVFIYKKGPKTKKNLVVIVARVVL